VQLRVIQEARAGLRRLAVPVARRPRPGCPAGRGVVRGDLGMSRQDL